ncbi:MAG: 4'-phosphopantetheinyl transferase superfamily protein [Elusimicrobia bacterium]|nr:4'-phosphopantetheinyl transferase superfamily protein [Elusimicrobiota bacterium]
MHITTPSRSASDLRPIVAGEVHLWGLRIARKRAGVAPDLLPAERAHAARFRSPDDRDRFVQCRSALRRLLAGYLGRAPSGIDLELSRFGKPFLAGSPLRFNVSHSGAIALLAFARDADVGVDIERVREMPDAQDIVDKYFSQADKAAFRRSACDTRAFFEIWTRKEARLKAEGVGLSGALDAGDAAGWETVGIETDPGYAAAVAVARPGADVLALRWLA